MIKTPTMSSAAVEAPVTVRSKDGFLLPIDVRLHCTVTAEQAPRLVALVGNPDGPSDDPQHPRLDLLATHLVLPAVQEYFRNIAATMDALDFFGGREAIEEKARLKLTEELKASHVTCDRVFIGNIYLEATDAGQKLLAAKVDFEIESMQQKTRELREARKDRDERAKAEAKK